MYIKLDINFYSDPKTLKLLRAIGEAAFWVPPRLWTYAAVSQPDGDFSDYDAEDVARALGYSGDANKMWEAMKRSGFIDADTCKIHNWELHGAFHQKYKERARNASFARWGKDSTKTKSNATSIPSSNPLRNPTSTPKSIAPSNPLSNPSSNAYGKEESSKEEIRKNKREIEIASIPSSIKPDDPSFRPPRPEEVTTYAEVRGWDKTEAEKFWNHFEASGWVDKNGNQVRSWKSKLATWMANARAMPAEAAHHANGGKPAPITHADRDVEKLKAIRREQEEAMRRNLP